MKTYNIITIGCQMNKSDSERVAGYLEEQGYKWIDDKNLADLVVVNTCGVRQSAEDRVYGLIPGIKKHNPDAAIVLTGCLSEREDVKKKLGNKIDMWLPIVKLSELSQKVDNIKTPPVNTEEVFNRSNLARRKTYHSDINSIAYQQKLSRPNPKNSMITKKNINISKKQSNILQDVEAGGIEPPELRVISPAPHLVTPTSNSLYHKEYDYLRIKPKYDSQISAFVPIGNGCDNFCSYCVVPYARGREVYRPVEDILDEARGLVERGYKEITLIAQNVNSYEVESYKVIKLKDRNQSCKINFADLLRMINNIKGDFWIRFATSHPKDMSDELIKTIADCDKICEHVHLPVQAGDDEILKAMNRKYTVEHYKSLIKKIRQAMPGVAVTTDIIVGFPGETEKQFNNTVKLFKEAKFDMAYIARYSPRPGTEAEKLKDDAPKEEKKRREEKLMAVLRKTALENNKKYIGKIVEILVEARNKKGEWYGKTRTGKNVRIKNEELKIKNIKGKFIRVKILEAKDFGLRGEIIKIKN